MTGRRRQLLDLAADLMAERGFHGVSVNDLAEAAGISGPALYRHFPSKQAVLGEMLVDISRYLLTGGSQVVADADSPGAALNALVAWHLDFALGRPALIRVQERDLAATSDEHGRTIRQLQREYAAVWTEQLRLVRPDLDLTTARTRVHAVFGLLNSTPHSGRGLSRDRMAAQLTAMGRAALLA